MTLKRFLLCIHPESLFEQVCYLQCGNKQRPTKWEKRTLCKACYNQGSSHYHLHFNRDTKAGKRLGKGRSGEKGRLQMYPAGGCCPGKAGGGPRAVGILCDWLGACTGLVRPKSEAGTKSKGADLLSRSWSCGVNRYRGCYLASWIVAKDINLSSCESGFQQAGLWRRAWCPRQVVTAYEPGFSVYTWCNHCPFV